MKRFFTTLLVFVLLLSFALTPFLVSASSIQVGDMNGDGTVDSADAIHLLYHTLLGKDRYPLAGEAPTREKIDLGGYEFRFLARKSSHYSLDTHEIYAESENGDAINDAVYRRNRQLEKDYHCKICEEKVSSPATSAREALQAGEYVADFLYDEARLLRTLAGERLLSNLNHSEQMDFDDDWYDGDGMDAINLGGKAFFILGDGAILDDGSLYLMRVNFDFLREYDPDIDLYQEVREGKWTVDRLYELMIGSAKDVNDDGLLFPEEDRFGLNAERATNFAYVVASGTTLFIQDGCGNITIPDSATDRLLDRWSGLGPLLTSASRYTVDSSVTGGLCTFSCGMVCSLLNKTDCGYELGLLPMPKFSADQTEYYTTAAFSQLCAYSIPKTAGKGTELGSFSSGVERAAYFLDAFFCYSHEYLTPVFREELIARGNYKDLEGAGEMLDIALENVVYDPIVGYNFGGLDIFPYVGSVQNGIPGTDLMYHQLAGQYQASVRSAQVALKNYLIAIADE